MTLPQGLGGVYMCYSHEWAPCVGKGVCERSKNQEVNGKDAGKLTRSISIDMPMHHQPESLPLVKPGW